MYHRLYITHHIYVLLAVTDHPTILTTRCTLNDAHSFQTSQNNLACAAPHVLNLALAP